jgi:DNA-binding transcriptional LysR family regulator
MDVRQIQYFIRVFEERSFSRAAEKANVVQPALSMQVRRLEEELAAALFDRSPRGLEPTPAGRRLYELCVPIVRSIAEARQEIIEMGGGTRIAGAVRIGIPPSVNRGILGTLLPRFAEAYPHVDVTIIEAYTSILTDQVHDGLLDCALGARPEPSSGLVYRTAFKDSLLLVAGNAIHGASFTPCKLGEMRQLRLILPSHQNFLGRTLRDAIESGEIAPQRVMHIDGVVATLAMARRSEWAAIFPFISMIGEIETKEFHLYPIVAPQMSFDLFFVSDPRRPLTAAARAFVAMLQEALDAVAALRVRHLDPAARQASTAHQQVRQP